MGVTVTGQGADPGRTTICAVASAPGEGERALVRVSGDRAQGAMTALCRDEGGKPVRPTSRGLFEVRVDDGVGTQPALLLWMPGPGSYTREDVAELHLVGNPALVRAVVGRLLELGVESAGPGEFTRRAFENGRLDLTRAEGVLALVEARNHEELRAAGALLAGGLGGRIAGLRERLETLRALAEASLDFDQGDAGHVPTAELLAALDRVRDDLQETRSWEVRRSPAGGLARVVLTGAPNAGKSALFNRLTLEGPEHRAIESEQAGTTRDAKHGRVRLPSGQEVVLVDTAGVEQDAQGVEAQAQSRRELECERADLLLDVIDPHVSTPEPGSQETAPGTPILPVFSKSDLGPVSPLPTEGVPVVSSRTGEGLPQLLARVESALAGEGSGAAEGRGGLERQLSLRHRRALDEALEQVLQARTLLDGGAALDLVAEALRGASAALDLITGQTTPEDLLDRIFSQFCLGK